MRCTCRGRRTAALSVSSARESMSMTASDRRLAAGGDRRARAVVSQPASARRHADRARALPRRTFPAFKWRADRDRTAGGLEAGACSTSAATPASTASSWRGAARERARRSTRPALSRAGALGRDGSARSARSSCGRCSVYDSPRSRERFDLVLFMGVLYHLRYPLLALDILAAACAGMLVFQTLTMPGATKS